MSRVKILLGGLALIIVTVAGAQRMLSAPIERIRVHGGPRHLRLAELRRVVTPLLDDYWLLDLSAVAAAVRRLPWVDRVRVERLWPDVLRLEIREQRPVLRWGKKAFLNERGERFTPGEVVTDSRLPLLTGPEGYEKRLFHAYRRMNAALRPLGWHIEHLEVDERRSWRLHLNDGVRIVLGRSEPEKTFVRVVAALRRLEKGRRAEIEYLDARYEHGFAIRWRTGKETIPKQSHG